MDIVVIAASEKKIHAFVAQINEVVDHSEIETFLDPLLAFKYMRAHKTDLLFAHSVMKHITITQFVKLVRDNCQDTDISVIAADRGFTQDVILAGADRLVIEPLLKDTVRDIVYQVREHFNG